MDGTSWCGVPPAHRQQCGPAYIAPAGTRQTSFQDGATIQGPPSGDSWEGTTGSQRQTRQAELTSGSEKRNPTKNRMGEEGENSRPALSDMGTTSHMGLPNTWR